MGLPEPTSPAMEAGKAYHQIISELYSNVSLEVAVSKAISKYSVGEPWVITSMAQAYTEEVKPHYEAFAVEQHVVTEIAPGVNLQGYIDLITTDDVIVDHKTAGRKWPGYRAHKDLQPMAYYVLYEALMGKPPARFEFHVVTKTDPPKLQILETSRSRETIEWYKEGLLEALDAINTGIFPPNPSYMYCSQTFCPFWEACRR